MRTGLTVIREDGGVKFYGEIADSDVVRLKLNKLDRELMRTTPFNALPEDQLLVIEMLFRRINEQRGEKGEG